MYPFITLGGRHIEMTGLGFIVGLIVFCVVCYIRAKQMNLLFRDVFYGLPTMIAITYFFGSYSYFVLNNGQFIPYTIIELSQIIIPPNYNFQAGGLIIGIILSILLFVYQKPSDIIRKKWIDCLFLSYMNGLIIFGLFLVLGDDMIGLSTNTGLGIYAMTPFSEVAKFNQVYPVGIFVSIAALLSSLYSIFILKKNLKEGWGIGGFGIFCIILGFVLLFQNYPKHGAIPLGLFAIDINQYIIWVLGILLLVRHKYIVQKSTKHIIRMDIQ